MELVTSRLTPAQVWAEVNGIRDFLLRQGIGSLVAVYGWGCNPDRTELWQDIPVATEQLPRFVEESIAKGIYSLGEADIWIHSATRECLFRLCHEQDIHFETEVHDLFASVRNQWLANGYGPLHER